MAQHRHGHPKPRGHGKQHVDPRHAEPNDGHIDESQGEPGGQAGQQEPVLHRQPLGEVFHDSAAQGGKQPAMRVQAVLPSIPSRPGCLAQ